MTVRQTVLPSARHAGCRSLLRLRTLIVEIGRSGDSMAAWISEWVRRYAASSLGKSFRLRYTLLCGWALIEIRTVCSLNSCHDTR